MQLGQASVVDSFPLRDTANSIAPRALHTTQGLLRMLWVWQVLHFS